MVGSEYFEHVGNKLPGVERSTGRLGYGFPVVVDMALGSKRGGDTFMNIVSLVKEESTRELTAMP